MAPTLVSPSPYVVTATGTTTTTTTAFTPADGEVLVVKVANESLNTPIPGTPSGGSLNYSPRAVSNSNDYCETRLWTAVVGTSPGSMSVSLTWTHGGDGGAHSMAVERWSGAQLDATPAVIQTTQAAGTAPSVTITTEANNSVVSWAIADWSATSPTSRAYRSSAVEEGIHNVSPNSYVAYYAYQAAASAGSQTVGMTAPTQKPSIVGIEVQASAAAPPAVLWPRRRGPLYRR